MSKTMQIVENERSIQQVKDLFTRLLSENLGLSTVPGPLFVEHNTGLNDDLSGRERCVEFTTNDGKECGIVHSLAKWKRYYLSKFKDDINGFELKKGIVTHMLAIRKDEILSPIHSYYVDQWDWEVIIPKKERTMETFELIVKKIYDAILKLEQQTVKMFKTPQVLPKEITFISSQELEDEYPNLSPTEREKMAVKKYGAISITQIGKKLKSGRIHEARAPDYDDWELNGDIIVYYEPLDCAFELTSMGIRVSEESLTEQLKETNAEHKKELMYHQMILNKQLPYTIGGGIGQSRLIMFMLKKLHIGEVHVSVWDDKTIKECEQKGLKLL